MEKAYKKKLSIGLSLDITYEEYKTIIQEYGDYIYSIFFSPPLGDRFHSRRTIALQLRQKKNICKLEQVLKLFSEYGIVVDADLNVSGLSDDDVELFIQYIKERPYITEITTLDQYADKIHCKTDSKLVYSFNNFYEGEKIKDYYSTVVVGKKYIRDIEAVNQLTCEGKDVKVLINNGCSFDCATCLMGPNVCEQTVVNHLQNRDISQLYAEQTIFPWELYELIKYYKEYNKIYFKISNRTSGYQYLVGCLDAYLNVKDVKPLINNNIENYSLFCRMYSMRKRFKDIEYEKVENEKKKLLRFL